jgi:uncharacterized protein YndB with AHSA1/START domain
MRGANVKDQTNLITVETRLHAPVAKVWTIWTTPVHVMNWNAASDDWHTISSSADFRVGSSFVSRMEAKDKSIGFDFGGTYTRIQTHALIAFTFGEGAATQEVRVVFEPAEDSTVVRETFPLRNHAPDRGAARRLAEHSQPL